MSFDSALDHRIDDRLAARRHSSPDLFTAHLHSMHSAFAVAPAISEDFEAAEEQPAAEPRRPASSSGEHFPS